MLGNLEVMNIWMVFKTMEIEGNSLAVQWLGLRTSTAGGTGSIPGGGELRSHKPLTMAKKKKFFLTMEIE